MSAAGYWYANGSKCAIQCPAGTWCRPPPPKSQNCYRWTWSIWFPKSKKTYGYPDLSRDATVRTLLASNPTPSPRRASRVPTDVPVGVTTIFGPVTTRTKCFRRCWEKVVSLKKLSADFRSAYPPSKGISTNLMKSLPGALSLDYVETYQTVNILVPFCKIVIRVYPLKSFSIYCLQMSHK